MSVFLSYLAQVIACLLFVDLLSGFVHWLEDCYGQADWPMIGKWVVQPNIRHHRYPAYFLRHNWFQSAVVLLVLGAFTVIVAAIFHFLDWHTWLIVLLGVNANEFHKWAHRSKMENGKLITLLQQIGILQSPAHHARHHRGGKNTHYCAVTNYLNPLLDGIRLWFFLEMALRAFGLRRRLDPTV